MQLIWHGTPEEHSDFLLALGRNCACDRTGTAAQVPCDAHRLLRDQRTVDRLLFARRIAGQLFRAEYALAADPRSSMAAQNNEVRHG